MRFVCVLFLLPMGLWGQISDPALRFFLNDPAMKTASVGVCVMPMDGDQPILEWQADTGLIPASTMKAVTTATALQILGPDFVFETKLYLKGGDLVVKGGGDPTLGATSLTGDFAAWLAALKAAGVNEIPGNVVVDPSRFESRSTPNDWPWGDVGNYYGAGPTGLNFHMNSFALTFRGSQVGGFAELIKVWPMPPGVEFENHMKTGSPGSGDQGYVYGGPGAKVISLRGTIPQGGGFTIRGALPDPPLMCATALTDFLVKNGIAVGGGSKVGTVALGGVTAFHVQKSPSLAKIVKGTNHRSVNLYADSIFKALTPMGSTSASVAKVEAHWKKQGVDLAGFVMLDGSGLSPRNTVTARQLTQILKKSRNHETGQLFLDSLPVAGQSGTMTGFGKGTILAGRVRAKSGSLNRVRTYAGFFRSRTGKSCVFTILTNNTLSDSRSAIAALLLKIM